MMVKFNGFVTALVAAMFLSAASSETYVDQKELAKVAEEFKTAGIVSDILPAFNPSALAYLTFDYGNGTSKTVAPGLRLGRNDVQVAPIISIGGLMPSKKRFVGIIVDPDAPSRTNHTSRSIRHYLAPDLTIGENSVYVDGARLLSNATYGTPAANDFRAPNPTVGSGPHRYTFFLFCQPENFDYSFLNLTNRASFNLSNFAERTGLGEPVAGTYFLTEVVNVTTVVA